MDKVSQSNPIKVRFIYALIRLFSWLPRWFTVGLMKLAAHLSISLNSRNYNSSKTNIAFCLPELTPQQQKDLVKKSMCHTFSLMPEISKIWMKPCVAHWIDNVYGEQAIKQDLAEQRKVMITGAHIGNWEVALFYLGHTFDFTCMYRQPRHLELDQIICKGRGKNTCKMVAGDGRGLRQFLKALNDGEVAALLSDQEPGGKAGIFAPFFGKPAKTMDLVQKIQQKTQAKLYQIAAIRNPEKKYDIHLIPVEIDSSQDPLSYATALNISLEEIIRRFPEQYQWSYKRFKSTEDGSANIYCK